MRVSKGKIAESILINVTPLIDIIFVILIFLVSCSEMSRMERAEEVQLPSADQANPETGDEADRWVVNLNMEGMAIVDGTPMVVNSPGFRAVLHEQAISKKADPKDPFSNRSLVIRADRRMPFRYVQQLILECQKQLLWKVKLQVNMPEAETKKGEEG